MNIQLRDSASLQAAIRSRFGKTQLPKAQLHPELLNGVVECDRSGFTIRSEYLSGELRGQTNVLDVSLLSDFISVPSKCRAHWKIVEVRQGGSVTSIPVELSFDFENGSKLVVRTQAVNDIAKLTTALPTDQAGEFEAKPEPGVLKIVRAGSEKSAAVTNMSEAEMRVMAARAGVKWDGRASRETMMKKIADGLESVDSEVAA